MTKTTVLGRTPGIPVFLLAAAAACGDGTGPQGRPFNLQEGRGTLVSASDEVVVSGAVWSSDGQWVYYLSSPSGDSGAFRLSRAAVGGNGSAVLNLGGAVLIDVVAHHLLSFVAPAPGGDVYLIASPDSAAPRGILRLSDGTAPTWLSGPDDPVALAVAPGGERLVYGTDLSLSSGLVDLWSYDPASETSAHLALGDPRVLSPDGAELLYLADDGTFRVATLATGATRPEDYGLSAGFTGALRWTSDGLLVLFSRYSYNRLGDDYYLRNVATGSVTLFYLESFDDDGSEVQAWSADGSRMALWFQACLEGGDLLSCDSFHSALYVVGVPDGTERWVAGVRDAQVLAASFSPDAGRIAYVIDGQLYVSELP